MVLRWISKYVPVFAAAVAVVGLLWFIFQPDVVAVGQRVCEMPPDDGGVGASGEVVGTLATGPGKASVTLMGSWSRFRGDDATNIAHEESGLLRSWPTDGPVKLWSVEMGEGYAGAAIANGCVYVMDYDREAQSDALRCLSFDDGREIWRLSYPVKVKRNHGMSRTIPSVTEKYVVAIGPKCHVVCCDSKTGELQWSMNMISRFKMKKEPPWYAGQCPLIDGDRVIFSPGGDALMVAVDIKTGTEVWRTENPKQWKMTHTSIVPMVFAGRRMYVYVGQGGVVGVDAENGKVVWETDQWKIKIAAVPSPVILDDGKIFLSGGYNSGAAMLQLIEKEGQISAHRLFKLNQKQFGAIQQTPVYYKGYLYGIRPFGNDKGELVCMDTQGKIKWTAGRATNFGLGPFLIADSLIYAMDDEGELYMYEATAAGCRLLGQARVLAGHESWGPLAVANGRLIGRDFTTMVCVELAEQQ